MKKSLDKNYFAIIFAPRKNHHILKN